MRWLADRINVWVILVGLFIAAALVIVFGLLVFLTPASQAQAPEQQAGILVIPAPSPTPTQPKVIATPTPTSAPAIDGIAVGNFVQIAGTEGQGLRLRSGAGTDNPPRFLGLDSEVFQVKDGPIVADGFTWWFLEAPYDPARSGWAASSFLQVINPTATP